MRRSAAPSLSSRPLKRGKFSTPFRNVGASSTSSTSRQQTCDKDTEVILSSPTSTVANTLEASTYKENALMTSKFVTPVVKGSQEKKDPLSTIPVDSVDVFSSSGDAKIKNDNLSRDSTNEKTEAKYFNVVWCKASKKKHKKWDGDGILVVNGRQAVLKDEDGKDIGKSSSYKSSELAALKEGESLFVGGKEIEVMSGVPKEEFTSGRCFNQGSTEPRPSLTPLNGTGKDTCPNVNTPFCVPVSCNGNENSNRLTLKRKPLMGKPRHNPDAEGAMVMPRPNSSHQWLFNKQGHAVMDVVIDPFIASRLRPHQISGVTFLYQCVMGMGNFNGNGAILADEMGLGKTLQCITLIWTLLKQGPYGGKPRFKRILIVTPGSLVKNWCAEFQKWLGNERIKTFAVSSEKRVEEFCNSIVYPIMIVSYEMLLRCLADVKKVNFDLIICDEGHRLKNLCIKTSSAIAGLGIASIVLLTGTPIQNDLKEFYALADLCNPGVFGSSSSFRRNFEAPIIRSQDPGCSLEEKNLGSDRAAELQRLTDLFVLRRTAELNQKFLPAKAELVVFCQLSVLQKKIYNELLSSRAVSSCISACGNGSKHLVCISALKKLCNHPSLLLATLRELNNLKTTNVGEGKNVLFDGLLELYPKDFDEICRPEHSGKLAVLQKLMGAFRDTKEKCAIVANSTKALDILEALLTSQGRRYARLDGKTPTSERQHLVDNFNKNNTDTDVFLLSSKAGGTGLNLIGASRLVLFDIDWNPANDLQAMARVWRDGQKRNVYIYRLLTTGTIEEKIYQRQISKQNLSGHIVDLKTNKVEFSSEDLKNLFKLDDSTLCSTHDLLGCSCPEEEQIGEQKVSQNRLCQLGQQQNRRQEKKSLSMAELMSWSHILPAAPDKLEDDALRRCLDNVTFVFQNQSTN